MREREGEREGEVRERRRERERERERERDEREERERGREGERDRGEERGRDVTGYVMTWIFPAHSSSARVFLSSGSQGYAYRRCVQARADVWQCGVYCHHRLLQGTCVRTICVRLC